MIVGVHIVKIKTLSVPQQVAACPIVLFWSRGEVEGGGFFVSGQSGAND